MSGRRRTTYKEGEESPTEREKDKGMSIEQPADKEGEQDGKTKADREKASTEGDSKTR